MTPHADGKTEKFAGLFAACCDLPTFPRILIIGCGSGLEAAILADAVGGEITGIDLVDRFDPEVRKLPRVTLLVADATRLPWPDGSFHLVYSYHALEHIPRYREALAEMERVLVAGGSLVIGTPNRRRLVGYLGSKPGTSWREKLLYNLIDWKYMIRGRFRNEYGAHAGFSGPELAAALCRLFPRVRDVTLDYYRAIHEKLRPWLGALAFLGLDRFLLPSVYFIATKGG